MDATPKSAPPPDLRIVLTENVLPHEEHDFQRSIPLIEQIQKASVFTNPPVVAEIEPDKYVLLDGANRCHTLAHLGYKHILVQVVEYRSEFVILDVWKHIVSGWDIASLMQQVEQLKTITIIDHYDPEALLYILTPANQTFSIYADGTTIQEKNSILRQVVKIYQTQANLYRTPLSDPHLIWQMYPDAVALVIFPNYSPQDIMDSTTQEAYLPPGVSRHVIHGRALNINYSLASLLNEEISLEEKNNRLQTWLQQKLQNRDIRYYAESVYKFDE